jgi:hypothetical protein
MCDDDDGGANSNSVRSYGVRSFAPLRRAAAVRRGRALAWRAFAGELRSSLPAGEPPMSPRRILCSAEQELDDDEGEFSWPRAPSRPCGWLAGEAGRGAALMSSDIASADPGCQPHWR